MKTRIIAFSVIIQLILAASYTAYPQQNKILIESELQRLKESFSFANELVTAFGNREARHLLDDAKRSIDNATEFYRLNRLDRAKYFILQAYRSIQLAMKITLNLSGRSLLEQLQDLIRQAEQAVEGTDNKEAERLLREAKKNLDMARTAYKNQMARETFEYYRIGTFLAKKALSLCTDRDKNTKDQFVEEKQRFEQLLQKAENRLAENPLKEAEQLIQNARKLGHQAVQAFQSQHYREGIEHYYRATRLLLRAIEYCESQATGSDPKNKLENEIQSLNDLIASMEPKFADTKNVRAKMLFEHAVRMRSEAQSAQESGRYRMALRKSELARNALRRGIQMLESKNQGLSEQINDKLIQLQGDLERTEELVNNSNNREARHFVELAKEYYDKSANASQNQREGISLQGILLAHRLLNLAEDLVMNEGALEIDKNQVEARLKEFEHTHSEAQADIESSKDKRASQLFQQSSHLYEQAKKAFEANELYFAMNVLELAFAVQQRSLRTIR